MVRIAIVGSTGYIGSAVTRAAKFKGYKTLQISRNNCNIYDVRELTAKISYLNPDWLINCAGYTGKPNVDACERNKAECLHANSSLPGIIGAACEETRTPWGHVGSGCIFEGDNGGEGFREDDQPNFGFRTNNCSFYSGTKALSEEVLAHFDCYIWRVRIPFNHEHCERNYLSKILRYETLLQATNSFSHLDEFSNAAIESFERNLPTGTYNLTQPGTIDTKRITEIILEEGLCDKKFKFFKNDDDFLAKAAITRRSNCVLNTDKALAAGLKLTPIEESIRQSVKNWVWKPKCFNNENRDQNRDHTHAHRDHTHWNEPHYL